MNFSAFLFSPHARVWNLRLLLLETIGVSAYLAIVFPTGIEEFESTTPPSHLPWDILFPTLSCIFIHHTVFVFNWPIRGLAAVDLFLNLLEVCGMAAGFSQLDTWDQENSQDNTIPTLLKFSWIPLGLSLVFSIIFRMATILRYDGSHFVFLGACTRSNPPYTPTAILLNRSVSRPLVRGESGIIILARALILSCLAVGVPIFGIYAIVINPIHASVYTRSVVTSPTSEDLDSLPGNVTFFMGIGTWNESVAFHQPPDDFSVNQVTVSAIQRHFNCSVTFEQDQMRIVECPSVQWSNLDDGSSISINLSIPAGHVVKVKPLSTRPSSAIEDLLSDPSSIPMISGSNLFGQLTWTQRNTLSRWVLGIPTASKPVFIPDITGLQPFPSLSTTGTNDATLLLYHPFLHAIKLEQDSLDITPLSGFSSFGGFWTFVEGAFVLFFGANVMYFALGRRPLSALGLIHIFQRRVLVRQWHNDFPRLRTEGGQPGSESAGIVAFIRERLIDIDQGAEIDTANDIEAQHSRSSSGSKEDLIGASTKEPGYGYGSGDFEKMDSRPS
ncbi:Short-chain dehydrogenase/reductase family protein [Mycena sanguinolenta]|uniref:Short-chain dehydrogenase/reductase family protein n=1 Tax=Mycena sanguinolenta TaxID=230812 RepID=A0A8H6Y2J9_9AGAR|nr:Short-chain dehydrogenase/reductase family protein [Mycena sanguinolenta]